MDFGDTMDSDTESKNGEDRANVQTLPVNLKSFKKKDKEQSKQTALHSHSLQTQPTFPHGLQGNDSPSLFSLTTTKAGPSTVGASIHGAQGRLH
jgi:hypothetical protein